MRSPYTSTVRGLRASFPTRFIHRLVATHFTREKIISFTRVRSSSTFVRVTFSTTNDNIALGVSNRMSVDRGDRLLDLKSAIIKRHFHDDFSTVYARDIISARIEVGTPGDGAPFPIFTF